MPSFLKVIATIPSEEYANVVIGEGDYVANYDGMVALHGRLQAAQWDLVRTKVSCRFVSLAFLCVCLCVHT